jgi:NAD(P)-dependent dehydrogenase (short-subunit alcohol dehydrogenase family)
MPTEREWALILGVSSGTGAAIARAVARQAGLDVFGMHRGNHQEEADALARDLVAAGARAELTCGDAAVVETAAAGTQQLRDLAGPGSVRLFVHSLADASLGSFVTGRAPFHPRQFEKTFRTMAHSFVFWAQQLVAQDLLAPGACLLALSNPFVDTVTGAFGMVSAAKAALEIYIRHLAFELGPRGIRVNLLKFGLVETPAVRRGMTDEEWTRIVQRVSAIGPYGRIATVDEVARFVPHLLGDDAHWLNGATIDFTGAQAQSLLNYVFHHR